MGIIPKSKSANEASDLPFFECPRDPAFDLVIELAFGDEAVELVIHRGQRRSILALRLEFDGESPIGGLDLLEADADPGPQSLLGIGVRCTDAKGEFIDVGLTEPGGFEFIGDLFEPSHCRQQVAPDPDDVEIESVEHPRRFEVAELNLKLDPGLQEGGTIVGVAGAEGPFDEDEKLGQINIAEQQRCPIDHGHNFLDGFSDEILCGRQVAEYQ